MADGVLIVGESGTGKSTSIMNLEPSETFIINVQGKPLPFFNKKYVKCDPTKPPVEGNVYYTDKSNTILEVIKYVSKNRSDIKTIIVDDYQYVAVNQYMTRIKEKGFEKFNDIGHGIWLLPSILPTLRDDLVVFILSHEETFFDDSGSKIRRAKRMGKLMDQQVGGIEGFFTYVLFTDVVKKDDSIQHYFLTNNEGDTTAKTPIGMFEEIRIPNDLKIIREKLN